MVEKIRVLTKIEISKAKLTYAATLVLSAAGLCRTVTFEGYPIETESQDCLVFWHQHPKNVIYNNEQTFSR